jgi:outer membrane receptor for ferrienterochelin and colicins
MFSKYLKLVYLFIFYTIFSFLICFDSTAQNLEGYVYDGDNQRPLVGCNIYFKCEKEIVSAVSDDNGKFSIFNSCESSLLYVSSVGYDSDSFEVKKGKSPIQIFLHKKEGVLNEVVVSGSLREISKMESPIPVEIYSQKFFKKVLVPNLFESLNLVNGVQPQVNCNVCNTGDIHINGMEGPYTMILIDGMPIVSSLSSVYGLSGIPSAMIERIEIVKGPSSTLYGSEAVGGLINIITVSPSNAPKISADISATTWHEFNADLFVKGKIKNANTLLGVNAFWYDNLMDDNKDGFTDLAVQKRISAFNKWDWRINNTSSASIAARYFFENRWGGQMNWEPQFKGTDSVYGESINTHRIELIGKINPMIRKERFRFEYSYNFHFQNSYYGTTHFRATQHTAFAQLLWEKSLKKHELLIGVPFRFIHYDDNTVATADKFLNNQPQSTILPGVFINHEWNVLKPLTIMTGIRYEYHNIHKSIVSPRLSLKYKPNAMHTLRLSAGNGFRAVNIFTEDHAALTGAREVVIKDDLKPERSWNVNFNYTNQINFKSGFFSIDFSAFYNYFTNKIIGDFLSDPNKIIYENLDGFATSRGLSLSFDVKLIKNLRINVGTTVMDVFSKEKDSNGDFVKVPQLFAPIFSGVYSVGYNFDRVGLSIDLTGNVKSPMYLPILVNDFRPEKSPWFTIVNLQLSKKIGRFVDVYTGVKNLFDFVPRDPIIRPFDPFDKNVDDPILNPNGYTFDPTYNYSSLQGARGYVGVRVKWY